MKKIKSVLKIAFVFFIFIIGTVFTACGSDKVVKIASVEGLQTSIAQYAEYDYSNAKVSVELKSGKTLEITSNDVTFEGLNTDIVGTQTLTITYKKNDVTVTYDVEVEVYEDTITGISSVSGLSSSVMYGEEYSTANAVATVIYRSNKTSTVLATDLQFSTIDTTVLGPQKLTITYGQVSYEMDVTVYNIDQISAITSVSGLVNSVKVGSNYNTTNAVATVKRTTGVTYTVTADKLSFGEINTQEVGEKTLLISYTENNVTVSFNYIVNVYEDVVVKAEIVENTFDAQIYLGEEFNTEDIILKLTYQSGETVEIDASQLEITNIDNLNLGNQEFTVSYKLGDTTYSDIATVEVAKNYTIMGFDDPAFVTSYQINSQTQNTYNATGSTGVKGFTVLNNPYIVGDDNEFIYAPTLSIRWEGTNNLGVIENYKAEYKIYLVEDTENTLLEDENLDYYVLVNEVEKTLKFTNKAVGKTFSISVLPKFITEDELDNISASEFTFNVIDGYNVYNAADLSLFDNTNVNGKWTEYKNANGIALDLDVKAIILQNNITIEREDIPSTHYWKESEVAGATDYSRVLNSLKDSTSDELGFIYRRDLKDGSTFKIEGNYFQISAQNLPLVVRENDDSISQEGEAIVVHTSLFGFFGDETGNKITSYELNNISLYGNTKKSDNTTLSGGVIFMKKDNCQFTAYNNLSQCWYIEYFNEEGRMNEVYAKDPTRISLNLKAVNAFDAFNSIIYNWGGVLNIEDSILIGAGGPVMICDHVGNDDTTGNNGTISQVYTKNSVLESWIAGSEGWFVSFNAESAVSQLKALNYLTSLNNVSFVNNDKINLIAVYKSGEAEGLTSSKIRGTFKDEKYTSGLDASRKSIYQYLTSEQQTMADQTYLLETYSGPFGIITGQTSISYQPSAEAFSATAQDYMNVYLANGMSVVIGLN